MTITKITYRDTDPSAGPDEGGEVDVPVSSFLGTDRVDGHWMKVGLVLDLNKNPRVMMRRYVLDGRAQDGTQVFGSVAIMAPPVVDRQTSERVVDQEQKDRILAALKILGKDRVTEEEMQELERDGRIPRRSGDPLDRPVATPPSDFVSPVGVRRTRKNVRERYGARHRAFAGG